MRRTALYSQSRASRGAPVQPAAPESTHPVAAPEAPPARPGQPAARRRSRLAALLARRQTLVTFLAGAAFAAFAFALLQRGPVAQRLTQKDIDKAVLHTLATKQIPSAAARAYAKVERSVVRVRGMVNTRERGEVQAGVGSGVIVVETGAILTNLHVVEDAQKIKVVFSDGSESDAKVIGTRPEHDLAVLQPRTLPDDMQVATLRSTADLAPGDHVVAVGFPFGIGPSASAGVVSGLRREFRSPEGERLLTNLIQFDAAANPGSSGGPLVTLDGEVVGIVTGILNPTEQRVFVGIGFAVPIENAASALGMHPF
jgi:S1-C subfamily serine protease